MKQRKLKGSSDRFLVTTPEDVGKEIRQKASEANLSYSAFIGLIIEDYLENQKANATLQKNSLKKMIEDIENATTVCDVGLLQEALVVEDA